ncbi:biotin-dependent carboxyltransferase family protein [Paenibacillus sp. Leaf72]|uniref:5-oxoprolinase subunit C family protein n=1 Tax=Paenibacillus sp. Leaf72 TaxID=1736234 RepID=UPI0006FC0CDA|nr:biotin-dependent carboxyltransferase family protein [Paenibacillus sp. Leaf72]KQO12397.1 hypothetical protein ASF12_30735 [Paenibacillus sp. Leaf72]
MGIRIKHAGLLTTVQDRGRHGYRQQGIIAGGAMDDFALRAANLLVGNDAGAAVLEATLIGPKLIFEQDALIAICGGNLSPAVQGTAVPLWRPVYIKAGNELSFGNCVAGARAYIAAAGGIDVPLVMGSRSTYTRAAIGGFGGRALKAGDVLAIGEGASETLYYWEQEAEDRQDAAPFFATSWSIGSEGRPFYRKNPVIRFVPGRHFDAFTEGSRKHFLQSDFRISSQSDRMGYRLEGPRLSTVAALEPISEAVSTGTIQVPAGGSPIILMADHQTIGGYPKIAQVATVDLPLLAQAKPGETIRFKQITRQKSEELYIKHELQMQRLSMFIEIRYREER